MDLEFGDDAHTGLHRYCGPGSLTIIPISENLGRCQPDALVAVTCECGERRVHRLANLQRGFVPPPRIAHLAEDLTRFCKRDGCQAEFVSPDDGVAMEG